MKTSLRVLAVVNIKQSVFWFGKVRLFDNNKKWADIDDSMFHASKKKDYVGR